MTTDPPKIEKNKFVLKCIIGHFQCFEHFLFLVENLPIRNPPPPLLVKNSTIYFFETFSKENIVSWTQVAIRLNKISPKQAQESLAAAMSLSGIIASWADCYKAPNIEL